MRNAQRHIVVSVLELWRFDLDLDPRMQLKLLSLQHFNCVVEDYAASVAHFENVFGAQVNYVLEPAFLSEGVQACLVTVGPVIFELVGAAPGSSNAFRRALDRHGPGYIGIEFAVDDLAVARMAAQQNGMRLKYDPGSFFVTDPRNTFGLAIECFDGNWFSDNPPDPRMVPVAGREYWARQPLGLTGLHGFTVAVKDPTAAAARWREVTGAEPLAGAGAGDGLWLPAGDTRLGLVAHGAAPGGRADGHIVAARLTVLDVARTASELAAKGLEVVEVRDGLLSVAAQSNRGIGLEFVQDAG